MYTVSDLEERADQADQAELVAVCRLLLMRVKDYELAYGYLEQTPMTFQVEERAHAIVAANAH